MDEEIYIINEESHVDWSDLDWRVLFSGDVLDDDDDYWEENDTPI